MINFPSGQLRKTLQELEQNSFSGMAEVTVDIVKSQRKCSKILILRQGKLAFTHSQLITPQELAKKIASQLNINVIDAAIKTAEIKVKNPNSFKELFTFLSRMGIIKSEQIEAFILQDILLGLEQLFPYGGSLQTNTEVEFDLTYETQENGWSITDLTSKLKERQQQWQKLTKVGIDSAEAVPKINPENIKKISNSAAQQHCKQWINGRRTIAKIAEATHQDPLKLAKNYYNWTNQNWIYFKELTVASKSEKPVVTNSSKSQSALPTVLSVDDSPVVQTMLKRSLSDRYEVLLANNGMDALKILNSSKKDIKLVLLDVTMPDIDGIELCRTIRRFKKFQTLPIIMLTAKDGMFDKVKGKFAGSTEYLTKPVDKEELLATIGKYVSSLATT